MVCYKDKTFCNYKECPKFNVCSESLTKNIIEEAKIWWGNENPPICITNKKCED